MTRSCREDPIGSLYGEPSPDEADHVAECDRCQTELAALRRTHAIVAETRPEAGPAPRFEAIWSRLEPELDAIDWQRRRARALPAWLTVAASLLLALWVFRGERPKPNVPEPAPPAELVSFFDRTQPFLLSLANVRPSLEDEAALEMVREDRARAADLADEARELRDRLTDRLPLGERNLLADIELLLMQVANLRETEYPEGLELVRTFMSRRTILFELALFDEGLAKPMT